MQKHTLFNVALTLSLVGTAALPGMAQTVVNSSPTTVSSQSSGIVIPQSSGIIIAFPAAVTVDAGKKDEYPLTLPLAQALMDSNGNVVVPENTPVSIKLKPINKGAQIIAESLVVGGQIVPINATSPVIPGSVITQMKGNDKAIESGAVYGRLTGSIFGFMGKGDPDKFDQGAMIGSALGMLSGLKSPEKIRVVQISQGSVFVL
ncbi:MAG TPA: hypothetical protein V6C63_14405, partial [Allocoleopsis sp.]